MTDASDDLTFDPHGDGRTLEELLPDLRQVQLYMIRMDMIEPVESPIGPPAAAPARARPVAAPPGADRCAVHVRSQPVRRRMERQRHGDRPSRFLDHARRIAETEPFHSKGLRVNSVHGWQLSEGALRLSVDLFDNRFEIR
ncbi:hypothetical protein [Amycolatopsis sp. NPDC051061]|uniref:hypothetical protein n=1 Tax=Amycolatopsis sp. NPDC051061 TaxID=3155042 RepID=UPI003420AE50